MRVSSPPGSATVTGLAGIRVHRDGRWEWIAAPTAGNVRPVTFDEVTAAFEERLQRR